MVNSNVLQIARDYKQKMLDMGLPIEKIILFGSYAKGNENKWSDIDICVVSPIFGVDSIAEGVLLSNIGNSISTNIEPHSMTKEGLSDIFSPISNEIRKYGIEI